MVLRVDQFGNVQRLAAVDYARRAPDLALSDVLRAVQSREVVLCTDSSHTNAVELDDDYRTPLLAESQTYELLNLRAGDGEPDPAALFGFDEIAARIERASDGVHDLPYEDLHGDGVAGDEPFRRVVEHVRTVYRRNDLTAALPLAGLESRALRFDSFERAFTPGLLDTVFGPRVNASMLTDEGGYRRFDDDDGWWAPVGRVFYSPDADATPEDERAQAATHFFMPRRFEDPFGNATTVTYDRSPNGVTYDLFASITRDAVGNENTATFDYRVLQPRLVVDPNGNRTAVSFDALGHVTATAIMGREDAAEGDALDAVEIDEATILDHFETPLASPHTLLGRATTRVLHDLFAYRRTRELPSPRPAAVCTIAREVHVSDDPGGGTRVQQSLSYADGFGREIQRKVQAEPDTLDAEDGVTPPRWVGSGWTVFNNKGKPVRQFEPFFSATHTFEFERQNGVSGITCYDPLGRVVATVAPNNTWAKTVFDAWREESWDSNDTVLIDPREDLHVGGFFARLPEADYLPTWHAQRVGGLVGETADEQAAELSAARKAERHAATPTVTHHDTQGRVRVTVAHNRFDRDGDTVDRPEPTRVTLDVEGNQREAIDASGRTIERVDFDMRSNVLHRGSMDAGARWSLPDVSGRVVRAWDSRGHAIRTEFDRLRRPIRRLVQGTDPDDPARELLTEWTEYGEGHPEARARNLHTRVFRSFDGAGVVTNVSFDFKGNLRHTERRLALDHRSPLDWSRGVALSDEALATTTSFDAMSRPITVSTHDGSVVHYAYNEANLLERVTVSVRGASVPTTFVRSLAYDAKGQRQRVEFGNGVVTEYTYDRLTFRVTNIRSTRPEPQARLQDLHYTYDPTGNITAIRDEAQQRVFFANAIVTAASDYTYDAVYQLVEATGREHVGQLASPQTTWDGGFRVDLPHPHDGRAMRRYTEHYEYDDVGNVLRVRHVAGDGNWTREFTYQELSALDPAQANNRLSHSEVAGVVDSYTYDAHGNISRMPHLPVMRWDHHDRLQSTSAQSVNGGVPETTHYAYDAAGHRVRKVSDRQASGGGVPSRTRERVYVGPFERFRRFDNGADTVASERQTLRVLDGEDAVAIVETEIVADGVTLARPEARLRYQMTNHLGSVAIELDTDGAVINYEEYLSVREHVVPRRRCRGRCELETLPLHQQGTR